jgi:hypothetical protein
MRKAIVIAVAVLALAVALVFVWPVVQTVLFVLVGGFGIKREKGKLQQPAAYEPVATALAYYCQSDTNLFPEYISAAWLPATVRTMGAPHGRVRPDGAYVEFGGGFYHFGYALRRAEEGALSLTGSSTNVWQLFFLSEGSSDKLLYTVRLPATNRLETTALLRQVGEGYDALIAASSDDERVGLYQGKIQMFLRCDRVMEARAVCRDMLRQMPDEWWAVLVVALVNVSEKREEPGLTMHKWVLQNPNFFSYLDLAYYYQLQGQPKEAAAAMIKATEYDANVGWGHGGNAEHRGYAAAMDAFRAGEYAATIKLCDHLLPITINGDYAKAGLRDLKTAASRRSRGEEATVSWNSAIAVFDAFEHVDIEELLQRKVQRFTKSEIKGY